MTELSVMPTAQTIGLDIGDRFSHYCVLGFDGEIAEEGRVRTTPEAIDRWFSSRSPVRVAVEVGTQANWIADLAGNAGHYVIVANPRKVRAIYENTDKCDRVDAQMLARLARSDPRLLHPVTPRDSQTRVTRSLLRSRDVLVRSRTKLINHVRGTLKIFGARVPKCSSGAMAKNAREQIPFQLRGSILPILDMIAELSRHIRFYDRRIEALARERYPQSQLLQQVAGVGALTAVCYIVTICDPKRFRSSRTVGSFVGLRPGRSQSGQSDPQLRITKAGDRMLRRLLVTSAHYILGPFGPDTDLRRYGMRIASHGGKAAKKRAAVAVARKLAVLLHRLWLNAEVYQPLRAQTQ
jgi:transposase